MFWGNCGFSQIIANGATLETGTLSNFSGLIDSASVE